VRLGVQGDWFGLPHFDPGPRYRAGRLFLLQSVGSTRDFLRGRGGRARGRLCRWDGWGWQAGETARLRPVTPAPGTIVVALRQTRGQGRQGRAWLDLGGLHMSWALEAGRQAVTSGLAVWTGLMIALVLGERCGMPVALKWPNDLLLEGRKIGGLILDIWGGNAQALVVAGLGLNLSAPDGGWPRELAGRAGALAPGAVRGPRPAAVAGPILARLAEELPAFHELGWAPYREHLIALDWLRGRRVSLECGERRLIGVADGIDVDGALRLVPDGGPPVRLLAGEAHVVDVESADGEGAA
jgi:BirA family biotin operon repressor/biotin-[acetyl-CoA-carboxylase] ligase